MRACVTVVLVASTIVCACASGGAPVPRQPTPAQVAALEARASRDSSDIEAQLRLAGAYREQGRAREALSVAERALARRPNHARAALLVGLTHEDLGDYAGAREFYLRAIRTSPSPRLRSQLRSRLVLLQHREMQARVRVALAREAELAGAPPRPRTLAVFPLAVPAGDSLLEPLGRALTAMLITDLSQTDRLTVLDRVVVQLLLDELRLGESGLVDQATAARGGRLLGAERILQGSLVPLEELLRLEAAVAPVGRVAVAPPAKAAPARARAPEPARRDGRRLQQMPAPPPPPEKAAPAPVPGSATVAEADRLDRLLDMEKRTALKLYDALGIELTPAQRAAVTQRRTASLQALLAYGKGLRAADAGDFAAALRFFMEAGRLDPGFAPAREEAAAARAVVAATGVTTEQLVAAAVSPVAPAVADALPLVPAASGLQRDATVEILGTEGVTSRTILDLVIRRPGGAQ